MKGDCDTRTVLLYPLLKNMGYDLLSADPAEVHRGLIYLRDHQQDFVVDKTVIADRKTVWA